MRLDLLIADILFLMCCMYDEAEMTQKQNDGKVKW